MLGVRWFLLYLSQAPAAQPVVAGRWSVMELATAVILEVPTLHLLFSHIVGVVEQRQKLVVQQSELELHALWRHENINAVIGWISSTAAAAAVQSCGMLLAC